MRFSDLKVRAMTGFPLAGAFLGLVALSAFTCTGSLILFGLGLLVVVLCCWEFILSWRLSILPLGASVGRLERWVVPVGLSLALLVPSLLILPEANALLNPLADCERPAVDRSLFCGILIGLVIVEFTVVVLGRESKEAVTRTIAAAFPSFVLVGIGGAALSALTIDRGSPYGLLWLAFVVCLNDICAYFAGAHFGGAKLSPHLSPGKTLSGSAGGILGGTLTAIIVGVLLPGAKSVQTLLFLGVAVVLAAQSGDLLKSYLKRIAGVKDFGSLLPGHGGVFDRLDGMLAGAPLVLFFW